MVLVVAAAAAAGAGELQGQGSDGGIEGEWESSQTLARESQRAQLDLFTLFLFLFDSGGNSKGGGLFGNLFGASPTRAKKVADGGSSSKAAARGAAVLPTSLQSEEESDQLRVASEEELRLLFQDIATGQGESTQCAARGNRGHKTTVNSQTLHHLF